MKGMEKVNGDKFITYDVYQSAYLVMMGAKPVLAKDERGKVVFVFDEPGLRDKIDLYNGGDKVDVLKFVSVIKNLRNQIYTIVKDKV